MFKVSKAIVTRIKSQMVEIEKQNESTNAGIILKRKRNEQVAGLSDLLYQWFEKARDKGLSRSDDILRDRAKEIAKCLSDSTFKASNGFLYKWLKLYNISLRKMTGEALRVNFLHVEEWKYNFKWIYNEFPLSDIYNADEKGLFLQAFVCLYLP